MADYVTRKKVYLQGKCVKLEHWWMDKDGKIAHDCKKWHTESINDSPHPPLYLGRTKKGFNPIKGIFGRVCVNCGEDAPDWLEQHSMLRRLR